MSQAPPDVVDELYGAPLEEFIARRDARAKELRGSDRAVADAVKKLRKPSASAAAVNRLARDAADDVEALLAAGEALRQAQLGGGDRDAIRDAARDEREGVERLVDQAGRLSGAVREEVRETLHAAATDEEARELVRRGVLTEARRAVGLGGFGAAPAAPAPARKKSTREQRREEKERERQAEAEAERTRKAEAEAERKRVARERVKEARAALREAEKEVERRRRALERAEKEAG